MGFIPSGLPRSERAGHPQGLNDDGSGTPGFDHTLSYGGQGIRLVPADTSRLAARSFIALPFTRNIAAYDVVVATPDGRKHANVQVKTSLKRVTFFPMPPSSRVRAGERDWYVLLRWLPAIGHFESFMLSGRQARLEVQRGERFQARRIAAGTRKKIFPSIYVGPKADGRANRWRTRWLKWKL